LEKTFQVSGLESSLGVKLEELQDGMVRLSLTTNGNHGNVYGIVHGGILASLSDIVMATACVTLKKRIVTLDMNISYIKNAPVGSTLTAVGEVIGNGRTIVRTTGKIIHGEVLLTSAQASYYVTGDGIKQQGESQYG
jgi:acyl-CoA thioesterase